MEFITLTLLLICCSAVYLYIKRKRNFFKDLEIPYFPGWPILGTLGPAAFRRKHMTTVIKEIYDSHPTAKYVGAFDFMRPTYVLRDPELIKSVTIKNFDSFPDHNNFIDDELDPLFGGNLVNMAGERWKEARNLLSPAFTSSKMKAMFGLMAEVAENFVNYLENLKDEDRKMVATKDLFTKYTNDVIATCAFGIKVDSLKDPKNEFYVRGKEATKFEGKMMIKFLLARSCPAILKLFNIHFVEDHIATFFTSIVKSTIAMRDEKGISRPDMLQLMMDARGKESKNLKLDITEMTAQAFIFFFGGFDTTSTQMCIIAHELAINPTVQKNLQEEIDEVLTADGKPTYETINEMPYLDAVFNESMRLHSQGGLLDRLCVKPFELPPALPGGKSVTIKPGMNVWIPALAIHRDPQYYEDPEKFYPERYYQKKVTINDVTNMGFGIGPRSCIGNRFAILETKILFFYLLSKFNLKPNVNTCSPLTYSKSTFLIKPDGGFSLDIEPRSEIKHFI